ncbi:unnamed protein product [Pedinophyceae sp. YPF-701]|nr:unnamed protein product [Pedinophyceae sp. YPF-701]
MPCMAQRLRPTIARSHSLISHVRGHAPLRAASGPATHSAREAGQNSAHPPAHRCRGFPERVSARRRCIASSSGRPAAELDTADAEASLVSRAQQRAGTVEERFRLRGSSFEGRQSVLHRLRADDPIILTREPTNPHDPHAVVVRAIDGTAIGYVPRELTKHVLYGLSFGRVYSIGDVFVEDPKGGPPRPLRGAQCATRPLLPPLSVDIVPSKLAPAMLDLADLVASAAWQRLSAAVLARAQHRCQVCGRPGNSNKQAPEFAGPAAPGPLTAAPVWEPEALDPNRGKQVLRAVVALCPACSATRRALALPGGAEQQPFLRHLAEMNAWATAPSGVRWADTYCAGLWNVGRLLDGAGDLGVDVSWLLGPGGGVVEGELAAELRA